MNNDFTVYDLATGSFPGMHINCDDAHLAINTPAGCSVIPGKFDHLSQRLNLTTHEVEDWQPPRPSAEYEWNDTTRRWQLSADAAATAERGASARAQIEHLETNVQPRAQRELLLAITKHLEMEPGRLQQIEDTIATARQEL